MAKAKTGTDLRVASGIRPQTNRYYAKVALRYRLAAVVLGVVLALFCLAVLVLGSEYITYANLTYLVRDFDLTMGGRGEMAAVITYPRHEDMKFAPLIADDRNNYRDGKRCGKGNEHSSRKFSGESIAFFT